MRKIEQMSSSMGELCGEEKGRKDKTAHRRLNLTEPRSFAL